MHSHGGSWIVCNKPRPAAKLRLLCFPHAGGGAGFFRDWSERLPRDVEVLAVQPPGREEQLSEPAYNRFQALVGALVTAIRPILTPPYAFFGHSMGALVAFEVARQLRRLGYLSPIHLIVSGRRAPTCARASSSPLSLSDAEMLARLREYEGTPQSLLEHREFMQLLLPTLRADFQVCESYRYDGEDPLDCALTAFGGDADPEVSRQELLAWRQQTRSVFAFRQFSGGHFYLQQNPEFFAALAGALVASLPGTAAVSEWHAPPNDLVLGPQEVHVWRACIDLPHDAFSRLKSYCTEEERARADRLYHPWQRDCSLGCRGILREIVATYLGRSPNELAFVANPAGKLELLQDSTRPRLRFNVSHSGSVFLLAVAWTDDVGVDVEQLRPLPAAMRIAESYFAVQEREALRQVEPARKEQAFFRCWTRKEAYLKARGDGLSFGLDRFAVSVGDAAPPRLLWVDQETDTPNRFFLADVVPADGYTAAVAVRRPVAQLRLWKHRQKVFPGRTARW